MDGNRLSRATCRKYGDFDFPALRLVCLSGALGRIRELVAAVGDHSYRASLLAVCVNGIWSRGMDNNLITQIGFVVLIGLAAKNAVLIVEFAKQLEEEGETQLRRRLKLVACDFDQS